MVEEGLIKRKTQISRNIMVKELKMEKNLVENKDIPIKYYKYSCIKDLLEQKYG